MPGTGPSAGPATGVAARSPQDRFLALWQAARPVVGAYILARVRDQVVADDVEQDTICAAWAAFGRYDPERSFGAWVMGIARHKVVDRLRGRAGPEILDPFLSEPAIDELTDDLAARREALDQCLDGLGDDERDLLASYYQGQEESGRIASRSGMSITSLRVRLHRLRQALRRCIERRLRVEERGA